MSVLWDHSNTLEWYAGSPAAGALAYFFVGGTTTPLTVYEDAGEGTPQTDPVEADTNGRWPNVFIPFLDSYDVKVTTASGTQLYYPTNIPNADPNPSATTGTILTSSSQLFQTGGMRFEVAVGAAPTGWVRANGLTIGNAISGATERANADTALLYTYLFDSAPDSVLPVTGGRGASASATFALGRPIALPDMRGGLAIGADTMGNTAAGRFATATIITGSSTVAASVAGGDAGAGNVRTLVVNNLAVHTHSSGTLAMGSQSVDHTHAGTTTAVSAGTPAGSVAAPTITSHARGDLVAGTPGGGQSNVGGGVTSGFNTGDTTDIDSASAPAFSGSALGTHSHNITTAGVSANHSHTMSGSTAASGANEPMSVLSRSTLGTWLIKL